MDFSALARNSNTDKLGKYQLPFPSIRKTPPSVIIGDCERQERPSKPETQPLIKNSRSLILNGRSRLDRKARRLCLDALESALNEVEPYRCVKSRFKVVGKRLLVGHVSLDLSRFSDIFILGVGKASQRMAAAALEVLNRFSFRGIVVAPKGQKLSTIDSRIDISFAGHPLPDRGDLETSQRVIQEIRQMTEDELLLCLISGGASALLPCPVGGITLHDKIAITQELMKSGASIHELNTVRRHLSNLKGGRLVELCPASSILSLIISDVPGNQLHDIGSGLTAEDPTTFSDAVVVLRRYSLWQRTPSGVKNHLLKGMRSAIAETPKPNNPSFKRVHNVVIADNRTACEAADSTLKRAGVGSKILSTSVEMEARNMGQVLTAIAGEMRTRHPRISRPSAVIMGGEMTVRVTGSGVGGRNQEVALSAVSGISGFGGTVIAAIGTDGIDGNSNAAGAIIDGNTLFREEKKTKPQRFLKAE